MKRVAVVLGVLIAVFTAVASLRYLASQAPSALAPEVIYYNGKIATVNASFDIVEAVAVRDGRIVAVGSSDGVRTLASGGTQLVDLRGKTVLPGFYDNHVHLSGEEMQEWRGALIGAVPEWLRGVDTKDELLEALKGQVASTPKGQWIRGELAREDWPNQKVPTRWDLDAVSPEHPVVLNRGPHTLIVNSLVLRLAGITRNTPDPPGGWIIRDENGEPNGRVLEAADRLVARVAPAEERGVRDEEQALVDLRRQLLDFASLGMTSVNIAGVRPDGLRQVQELYTRWGAELPRATVQVRLSPGYDSFDDLQEGVRVSIQEMESLGFRTGWGDERLKLGAIKMSIDGGLSAPVFWSLEPYEGRPDFYGAIRIPAEAFYPVAKRAHELGWQLGIHTMGDGAVKMVVDELERILAEIPRPDHRHHLHHVAVKPPDETIEKMARLGIMVSSQPNFTVGLGAYAVEALAGEREATQNPTKTFLDGGIRVSYGSDGAPYGPLLGIWTAVTRKGWDEKVYGLDEAVDVRTAIRLHTLAPAYQTFDEGVKGTLEVGKLADMVVLSDDILSIDPDRIRDIRVERTIVGGRQIYPAGTTMARSGR